MLKPMSTEGNLKIKALPGDYIVETFSDDKNRLKDKINQIIKIHVQIS